jgi:DNA-binding transcriptional regulator/RsmH inhibitor MraZ
VTATATRRLPRLVGQRRAKLDDKGRLVLPSEHRERFAEDAVLLVRGDHLGLYEGAAWDDFLGEIEERRRAERVDREAIARITQQATEVRPDSAGRILIPTWMREAIGLELKEEVSVAGNGNYLGIYRPARLAAPDPDVEQRVNELLNSL